MLLVDAPVSGGAMGAADGSLAIMVGGSDEAYAAARPALDAMGSKVIHAGPIGAGTKFKLARNMMHFISFTAATEAQRLAEAAGLDLRALGDVVRHTDAITGGPGAIMHRETAAPIAAGRLLARRLHPRRRPGREGPRASRPSSPTSLGVDTPLADLALRRLRTGLGL